LIDVAISPDPRRSVVLNRLGSPPSISFLIINWNHAAFVGSTIESVKKQDYPAFNCVVVDNASSDGSQKVIEQSVGGDPRFSVLSLNDNLNQMGALLHVLDRLSGELVAVIDSDDLIFPEYALSHAQIHHAIPGGVGFTSSCALEVATDGQLLTGKFAPFGGQQLQFTRGISDIVSDARLAGISAEKYRRFLQNAMIVPVEYKGWAWSAGSANVYRRDVLELARPYWESPVYVAAIDNYYVPFANALASSALIDMPLSAYRLHESNRFASAASIAGLRTATRAGKDRSRIRRKDIIDTMCRRADVFVRLLGHRFWEVMDTPAYADGQTVRECYESEQVQGILAKHYRHLSDVLGSRALEAALRDRLSDGVFRTLMDRTASGAKLPS
jgi:glycosyltransferase involved in cell wall biosynthesis